MSGLWGGLLPKTETQAWDFVKANPQFDGRGVVVGILDTGVDPAAAGLQQCPDGRPKVIDVVDCSGSGDVHMSQEWLTASDDGKTLEIPAVLLDRKSTKKILLNRDWKNPTGKYRYACKQAFEGLFPGRVIKEVKADRKKAWEKRHSLTELALQQQLMALTNTSTNADGGPDVEEVQARIAVLRSLGKDHKDTGPVYDCLVWHNGDYYEAAINRGLPDPYSAVPDSTEAPTLQVSDFSSVSAMCDYRLKRQYARFSEVDSLTYAVNIFDDGSILSVVTDAGAHGTHVAGIVAAYHPPGSSGADPSSDSEASEEDCNGVAPGAQIISFKIGDTRLDSMETGVGLVRACIEAVKRGCHIVNMSYGEASAHENMGYFVKLANDIVSKHNVIFVSSAGNNGPALTSVGCPGGMATHLISVGAFAPQSLMPVGYHMNEEVSQDSSVVTPTNYTWSSVGPSPSGALGVSILAPGGAITCVPTWTKNKSQLMNGTSMSSPNACGCLSLLLSGAIAQPEVHYGSADTLINYAVIRRAVESTAKSLSWVDTFGQGYGLVQVQAAWEYLQRFMQHFSPAPDPWRVPAASLSFTVSGGNRSNGEGIYLRNLHETCVSKSYSIDVSPLFAPQHSSDAKIAFEQRVSLKTIYKAPPHGANAGRAGTSEELGWISHTSYMLLVNSTKTVTIKVDPTCLPAGHHLAVVVGYMTGQEQWGSLFEIPVTVVKPRSSCLALGKSGDNKSPAEVDLGMLTFEPASRIRHFLVPPPGALYAEVFMKDLRGEDDGNSSSDKEISQPLGGVVQGLTGAQASPASTSAPNSSTIDCSQRIFVCHALQLLDNQPYRDNDDRRYFRLERRGQIGTGGFRVTPGHTLELCLSRYWSTLGAPGDVKVEVKVVYRGITPNPTASHLVLRGGCRVSPRLHVTASLSEVEVAPQGKLTHYSRSVRPVKRGRVLPLGERDVVPDDPEPSCGAIPGGKTLYQVVIEYRVILEAGCSASFTWPGLQDVLYESRFHSQFATVYSASNERVFHGDAFDGTKTCKIGSGEGGVHMVRLDVRHPTATILENLADLPCVLVRSLAKPASLSFYARKSDCLIGGSQGKLNTVKLSKGQDLSFYAKEPVIEAGLCPAASAEDQAKKTSTNKEPYKQQLQVGDVLLGKVSYLKDLYGSQFIGPAKGGSVSIDPASSLDSFLCKLVVSDCRKVEMDKPTPSSASGSSDTSEGKGDKDATGEGGSAEADDEQDEALDKAVLDAKVKHLQSLAGKAGAAGRRFERLLAVLKEEAANNLLVRLAGLRHALALYHEPTPTPASTASGATAAAAQESRDASPLLTLVKQAPHKDAAVLAACDDVLSIIDATSTAASLGTNKPSDTDKAGLEARKDAKDKASALAEVYSSQAWVLLLRHRAAKEAGDAAEEEKKAYEASVKELQKWGDLNDPEYFYLWLVDKYAKGQWGAAAKRLAELLKRQREVENASGPSSARSQAEGGDMRALTVANLSRELHCCLSTRNLGWAHISEPLQTASLLQAHLEGPDR